jgi:hypothetical protein
LIKWLIVLKGRPIKEEALDAVDEEEGVVAIVMEALTAVVEEEAVVEAEVPRDPREEERRTTLVAGCPSRSLAASSRRS